MTVEEVPEAVVNIHSCSDGPFAFVGGACLPAACDVRLGQVAEVAYRMCRERNLRPVRSGYAEGTGVVSINTLFHYLTGALPVCYEGPHGTKGNLYTHEEILEVHLTFAEVYLTLLKEEGLRSALPY